MQRGSVRLMFPVWLPDENYAMAGCNFFRGSPYDGYAERKVGCRNNPAWQEFRKKDIMRFFKKD